MLDRKRVRNFRILLVLGVWEICYFSGLIDPIRFSHPGGVIDAVIDYTFLRGFILLLAQLSFAALVGGSMGVGIGSFLIRSRPLSEAVIRLLRIGLWLPFLISWAIPISYTGYPDRTALTVWTWIVSSVAVLLYSCYHYQTTHVTSGLTWTEGKLEVIRTSILQALLIAFISQVWLGPYGWMYFWSGAEFIERVYAAGFLLFVAVTFINDACSYNFARQAKARRDIILRTIASENRKSAIDAWLIVLPSLIIWELLSLSPLDSFISSPSAILKGGYDFLIFAYYRQSVSWNDTTVSLLEILGGLTLAAAGAIVVCQAQSSSPVIKSRVSPFLPITHIVPFILPLCLNGWLGAVYVWWTLLTVAAVCFYPCMEVISGLWGSRLPSRILFAFDHALPFAFVAMIFGEAMSANAGLGFRMMYARATHLFPIGLGAALITVVFFIILSSIFRFTAKNFFSAEFAHNQKRGQS